MSTFKPERNWQLLCYLIGIIFIAGVSYATNQSINAEQDKIIKKHSAKLAEDDVREQKDAIAAALLKQDVATIKRDVAETRKDVKKLLAEVHKLN